MNLAEIPLFQMLKGRLGYLSERQKVISANVANTDTPRYAAVDLKPFSFDAKVQMHQAGAMAATQPGHIQPAGQTQAQWKPKKSPDSETTLDGNSVVLEEEMIKMSDSRMQYDAAIGFYQKSLNLLRLAARPPGRA